MGRNGTTEGDKTGGADQSGCNRHPEKFSDDYAAFKRRIIRITILIEIVLTLAFGVAVSGKGNITILTSVLCGFIGILAGIIVEYSRNSVDTFELKGKLITERMMNDVQCRNLIHDAQQDVKKEYNELVLKHSKVVANRVANRIVARHAKRLLDTEWREATIDDTNEIVEDELAQLSLALDVKKTV